MIQIHRYTAEHKEAWDNFIAHSKNGTFLLQRNYMDYHADRFSDFSLLALEDEKIIGLLAANITGKDLYSHQGLTYGGLIINESTPLITLVEIFFHILRFLQDNNIENVTYKPVPALYHKKPANEDLFIMGIVGALLKRVDTDFIIDLSLPFNFQTRRIRNVKKAQKAGVEVRLSNNFSGYWDNVLIPNLKDKYDAAPVHTLNEINLLHSRFPENIMQCDALLNNQVVAGSTLYLTEDTIHTQYISSIPSGREVGALDFLFHHMITELFRHKKYFSFGTANNSGNDLNKGVAEWKAGWGAEVYPNFVFQFKTSAAEKLIPIIQS